MQRTCATAAFFRLLEESMVAQPFRTTSCYGFGDSLRVISNPTVRDLSLRVIRRNITS